MSLEAILTVGWPDVSPEYRCSVTAIHEICRELGDPKEEGYGAELFRMLSNFRSEIPDSEPIVLKDIDRIFRRRTGGFSGIKNFVATLNEILMSHKDLGEVQCEIDVFAYAFLISAKNFDFFLPEIKNQKGPFREIYPRWKREMSDLEYFERNGRPSIITDTSAYLALRRIISRKSARDERRTLAPLLVSGPSTRQEITKDLGLPYSLAERILPTFREIGILDKRKEKYVIKKDALPRVIFCLREVMGLDLLPVLDRED